MNAPRIALDWAPEAAAAPLAGRLAEVLAAVDPALLDVAVLRLRRVLDRLEAQAAIPGCAARPLRRIAVLDAEVGACLLAGLPRLQAATATLAARPGAAARWLEQLRRHGALIALPQPWMVRRLAASAGSAA